MYEFFIGDIFCICSIMDGEQINILRQGEYERNDADATGFTLAF